MVYVLAVYWQGAGGPGVVLNHSLVNIIPENKNETDSEVYTYRVRNIICQGYSHVSLRIFDVLDKV